MNRKFLIFLLFLLFLFGCSSNTSTKDTEHIENSKQISQYSFKKEEFINTFISELNDLYDFNVLHITDVPNKENSVISTYTITKDLYLEEIPLDSQNFHLSVTSNSEKNIITNISLFTDKDNYIHFCLIANILALNLDETIELEDFEEKYKLLKTSPSDNTAGEEEKFKVSKTVNDEYISINFAMK